MNYGKKSVKRKKRKLQSTSRKMGRKCMLTFTKVLLLFVLAGGIIGLCGGLGVFKGIIDSAPTITLEDASPTRYSSFIYDSDGNQIAKLIAADSNRVPVTMEQIPQDLADAFVAIEDERFYQHNGIDIMGILRAGMTAIKTGFKRQEGASTITQQLIKNTVLTTWTQEKTLGERIKRKIQEQYLAIQLEKDTQDKSKILEQYMNTINLGQNTLGVQAASKRYFNKNVWDLNLSECATIAGITQNPSKYNPLTHPDKNQGRRDKVLNNMLEQGYITQAEYDEAQADTSALYDRIQTANLEVGGDSAVDSYYADAVKEAVTEDLIAAGYSETQAYVMVYSGGLSIFSAMDPTIQAICDQAVSNEELYPDGTRWLLSYQLTYRDPNSEEEGGIVNISSEMYKKYYQENGNKGFNLLYDSQEEAHSAIEAYKSATLPEGAEVIGESISLTPQPQISLVVEDQTAGYVVAMVGGRGTKEGNLTLNRATDTVRQPGSTFKIVSTYAPALDTAGMTLADVQVDGPFNYDSGRPVSNWYSSGYRGICSMRDGIRDSLNIVTVKFLTQITPRLGYEYLQKFGFTTLVDGLEKNGKIFSDVTQSLALGGITNGVKNIELNASYATIANGGQYIKPKLYTVVKDHDGNVILDNTSTEGTQVIKPSTAFLLTSAMQDVVTSGTGASVNFGGMTIAGKTGTTSDYNDIWFSGYTPYYTCSTWTGYDNNTKLRQGAERSLAKKLWKEVMAQIHEGLEPWDWEQPESVELRTDPRTGTEDYFSTTAELRAQQSLHDKEQAKLTAQLEQDIREFTTREISSVEDTYAVRSQYQDITSRLPLLDDGELRASMLEQVENRYDYFTGIISQMGDTIALYEKQKAIDDARAREAAQKQAEENRKQAEKDAKKNEFLQALEAVEELEYQQKNAQELVQDAISKLSLVAGDPDQQALSDRLQAAITRISGLPTEDQWNASQAESRAAEEAAMKQAEQQVQVQQNQLRSSLNSEKLKWNNMEYYGPGGRGDYE